KTNASGTLDIPFEEKYAESTLSLSFNNTESLPVKKIFNLPAAQPENSIQFFPEGGTLLVGALNKIAVKATSPSGLGIESTTYVMHAGGDTVATIATNPLGMGATSVFLNEGDQYHTITKFQDNTSKTAPLPTIQESGYNLQINNSNASKLFAQVNLSPDKLDGSNIYFMLHYMGETFHTSLQKASQAQLGFSVNKANLPTGILTITILNDKQEPILERPVFIYNPQNALPLTATLSAQSTGKRQKVSVALESGQQTDSIRNAVLSASVINSTRYQAGDNKAAGIQSVLYLSSELNGFIEDPFYYF